MVPDLSVVIPSRNEPYLDKTISDLFEKKEGEIEVIVILDGYLPTLDPRVTYIHRSEARGMRNGINSAVALAKGKYILKTDAHCMFDKGFDVKLLKDAAPETILVPRRYRLDPEAWSIIEDGRPPIDRMYLTKDFHGKDWQAGNTEALIEETPSSQGSCWFMEKSYFNHLELLDEETYGSFFSEFQEIGFKCWLSGGRVLVDKNTWYCHWHKDKRGYQLPDEEKMKARQAIENFTWHKQIHPVSWFWEHFQMP